MTEARVPDVSVVVPVYDALPYLRGCLDSLVGQSIGHARMQVVAVDDGSTDGGGEVLDEYAAAYPSLFVVLHQPNSGGPARPCNAGLDVATGRYVFFLGADDHLGSEALERMVDHADAWDSDVLCVKMVGTGGRWINQQLFREDAADVPFPSEVLAAMLSNTKLFRRDLLERHGIRYAHDLYVGSDQPFTIDAMRHARRVSAVGDYDYYFAVRREDSANLTYTSTWRHRLEAMTAVIEHVAPLLEAGEQRDTILQRHFYNEVAFLLREDVHHLGAEDQASLVAGVDDLARRFLTERILGRLTVPARLRYLLVREGRLDELRATAGLEEQPVELLVTPEALYRCLPEPFDLPLDQRRITRERPVEYLSDLVTAVGLEVRDETVELRLTVRLHPDSHPAATLALVPAREGRSRDPGRPGQGWQPALQAPLVFDPATGTLTGRLDLATLPTDEPHAWAVRLVLDTGEWRDSLPVPAPSVADDGTPTARTDDRVAVEHDPHSRLVLRTRPDGRRVGGVVRRAVRRARAVARPRTP